MIISNITIIETVSTSLPFLSSFVTLIFAWYLFMHLSYYSVVICDSVRIIYVN